MEKKQRRTLSSKQTKGKYVISITSLAGHSECFTIARDLLLILLLSIFIHVCFIPQPNGMKNVRLKFKR